MRAEVMVACEIMPRRLFRPSIPSHGIIEKEICKVVFVGWWVEVLSSNSDDGKAAAVHMLFAI
jgi:hypothetical protein